MTESAKAKQQIEELQLEIERHNRLYYIDATPEITDREYDQRLQALEQLEQEFPEFASTTSPTQRVGGAPLEGFKSSKHKVPMLSLKNADAKKPAELLNFVNDAISALGEENINFVLEPKIDGISISLRYENGALVQALTRGDGEWGDDVTANIKTIRSIPLQLSGNAPPVLEVRGEVYMSVSGFAQYNQERRDNDLEAFANPRNACAGTMKLLNPKEVEKRPLDAIFYGTGELIGVTIQTHENLLDTLSSFGLRTSPTKWVCSTLDEIRTHLDELDQLRDDFDFAIDGCVIKLNQREYYQLLGYRSKNPKWAIAYKYEPEQATTKLLDITIQVGRTGVLTPVAELEPVLLAGTTVKRATLHNAAEISRKKIKIGDKIIVEKAGEIIPAVVKVLKEERDGTERDFEMPKACPECGEDVLKSGDEVAVRCTNIQCPAQLKTWLNHFASRGALDIEGIGGVVADKLIERELVHTPLDLFELKLNQLAMLNLGTTKDPRIFGQKTALKIIAALEKSKSMPLSNWLFALGIPKLGKIGAKAIADKHATVSKIANSPILNDVILLQEVTDEATRINPRSRLNPPRNEDERFSRTKKHNELCEIIEKIGERLVQVGWYKKNSKISHAPDSHLTPGYTLENNKGVGAETAKSILKYLQSKRGKDIVNRLPTLDIKPTTDKIKSAILEGNIFVVTGTLPKLKRDEAKNLVIENGGNISNNVSKNTSYLLAGEKAGSKLSKARDLEVTVISENEFMEMLSGVSGKPKPQQKPGQSDFLGDL